MPWISGPGSLTQRQNACSASTLACSDIDAVLLQHLKILDETVQEVLGRMGRQKVAAVIILVRAAIDDHLEACSNERQRPVEDGFAKRIAMTRYDCFGKVYHENGCGCNRWVEGHERVMLVREPGHPRKELENAVFICA